MKVLLAEVVCEGIKLISGCPASPNKNQPFLVVSLVWPQFRQNKVSCSVESSPAARLGLARAESDRLVSGSIVWFTGSF